LQYIKFKKIKSEISQLTLKPLQEKLSSEQILELKKQITELQNKLLADKTYSMAPGLEMESKIKNNREGGFLTVRSGYFKGREAITFDENFIYLCDWASGCNQTPFILGFINWIDSLKNIKE
jgi:hypothetical protein